LVHATGSLEARRDASVKFNVKTGKDLMTPFRLKHLHKNFALFSLIGCANLVNPGLRQPSLATLEDPICTIPTRYITEGFSGEASAAGLEYLMREAQWDQESEYGAYQWARECCVNANARHVGWHYLDPTTRDLVVPLCAFGWSPGPLPFMRERERAYQQSVAFQRRCCAQPTHELDGVWCSCPDDVYR
jgi:hypothetical protein